MAHRLKTRDNAHSHCWPHIEASTMTEQIDGTPEVFQDAIQGNTPSGTNLSVVEDVETADDLSPAYPRILFGNTRPTQNSPSYFSSNRNDNNALNMEDVINEMGEEGEGDSWIWPKKKPITIG